MNEAKGPASWAEHNAARRWYNFAKTATAHDLSEGTPLGKLYAACMRYYKTDHDYNALACAIDEYLASLEHCKTHER